MRKIFALLLAATMMLGMFAMMSTSAALSDTSTAADVPNIVATEILTNSGSPDAFEYIEFYNRGDTPVDLADYCLLRAPNYTSTPSESDTYFSTWNKWAQKKFSAKLDIKTGDLLTNPDDIDRFADAEVEIKNTDTTIAAHSTAIIWFVNKDTLNQIFQQAATAIEKSASTFARQVFRDHYNAALKSLGVSVPADAKIIMVYSYRENDAKKLADDSFVLEDCNNKIRSFMYALALDTYNLKDDADQSIVADTAYVTTQAGKALNEKIVCLFGYGAAVLDTHNASAMKNTTAIYIPANAQPYYVNKKSNKTYADLVAANAVTSYKEVGILYSMQTPTPGTMPAVQWAIVDPTNAPATVKGTATWDTDAINAWLEIYFPSASNDTNEYRQEEKIEVDPPTQEELYEKFFGKTEQKSKTDGKNSGKDSKTNVPVIVGASAGGAVVVAAAVVVVIMILKKKKAAPAFAVDEAFTDTLDEEKKEDEQ